LTRGKKESRAGEQEGLGLASFRRLSEKPEVKGMVGTGLNQSLRLFRNIAERGAISKLSED